MCILFIRVVLVQKTDPRSGKEKRTFCINILYFLSSIKHTCLGQSRMAKDGSNDGKSAQERKDERKEIPVAEKSI